MSGWVLTGALETVYSQEACLVQVVFYRTSEGKEGKEENGSLDAPVNSEHEATVDWQQEAKVRRMKAESN